VSENILPASVNLVALDVYLENVKVLNAQTKFIFCQNLLQTRRNTVA
jgi:hypothetical protein